MVIITLLQKLPGTYALGNIRETLWHSPSYVTIFFLVIIIGGIVTIGLSLPILIPLMIGIGFTHHTITRKIHEFEALHTPAQYENYLKKYKHYFLEKPHVDGTETCDRWAIMRNTIIRRGHKIYKKPLSSPTLKTLERTCKSRINHLKSDATLQKTIRLKILLE